MAVPQDPFRTAASEDLFRTADSEDLFRTAASEDLARRAVGDERASIEAHRRRWLLVIGSVLIGLGVLALLATLLLG
jgi:hypothetical protein